MTTSTETTTVTPAPWVPATGLDADIVGHIQTKGWDKKSPADAALEAARAHREAEKLIGVPSTQLLRLPTDAKDEAGWKTVYQRLGAPADAKDYDFSGVKFADGTAISPALADTLRAAVATAHVSKDGAAEIATSVAKFLDADKAEKLAAYTADLAKSQAELKANWGVNYDANVLIAKQAAAALGVTKEDIEKLEKVVGFNRVMDIFRNIGTKIGEDKFVNNAGPQGGLLTREQAIAKINDLKKDAGWAKRYLDGGVAENRELQALIAISHGDDTADSRARTGR